MSIPQKTSIAVCASASSYDRVIPFSDELEALGYRITLPNTAARMKEAGVTNVEAVTDWTKSPLRYEGKGKLIHEHFAVIEKADAIIVLNYEKHGRANYIGPNVLMEMSTAFYLYKPIFVLNDAPDDSPLIDEILALSPIFLKGDIHKLPSLLKTTT